MILWMKAKLTTIIIATVAVFTVAGAGAVFAAQSHNSSSPQTSEGTSAQQEQGYEAQGVIQQVTFDQGTTKSGSLVFLPDGKQATVTVAFTTATKIEVGGDESGSDEGQSANGTQPSTLQAGMNAKVEGTLQTDGSVLAKEIQANDKNSNDDGNDGQDGQTLVGVIQSVDKTAQTFVLLPDGQTNTVTIAFDAKTDIGDEHDEGGSQAGLVANAHVRVEVVKRTDGSLYAKEVEPASGNEGSGDDGGDGSGHNGQPTPTPGGSGSGD